MTTIANAVTDGSPSIEGVLIAFDYRYAAPDMLAKMAFLRCYMPTDQEREIAAYAEAECGLRDDDRPMRQAKAAQKAILHFQEAGMVAA